MRPQPVSFAEPAVPGRDAQIGHIFRNMRAAMRLSREALARRLATTPAIIEDLENGAVTALPHWRETTRIVRSYCELLRLDPQPVLWRMQSLMQASGAYADDPPTRSRPASPPAALLRRERKEQPPQRSRSPERGRRRARRMFAFSAPLIVAAGIAYVAQAAPAPIYRAIGLLPAPVAGAARAGMDGLVLYSAPLRDGLRWVDVGDPQLRKGDKLQTGSR